MRRVLLDEGVPIGVRGLIVGFSVESVAEAGWAGLTNGDMIAAAESAGFEVMVTSAQNIQYQQNLTGRTLALDVLTTNHWATIGDHGTEIPGAVTAATPGIYVTIRLPKPARRRRARPSRLDC
jgi:hypothetical protein